MIEPRRESGDAEPVRTCVIAGYGINADLELVEAFRIAGSEVERVHITDLIDGPERLRDFDILAFPGGFSFGDHLGSGLVFAQLVRHHLMEPLTGFVEDGGLVVGICNGFQVLVKMGLLPNLDRDWEPSVSLIMNDSGRFEDRWVNLTVNPHSACVWTTGLSPLELPIRHGEGRFVTASQEVLRRLETDELVALRYSGCNPNGSVADIAGISDRTGRVLGLMPHPEAYLHRENHPLWSRGNASPTLGVRLFKNGVDFARSRQWRRSR